MPDDPDRPVAPLPPAEEARLRRLLAEVRETGPVPPDVAARMDRVLAGLAAERALAPQAPGADDVRPLARGRRHRVVAFLGAAAAVAVVGLGIGTFFDDQDGADTAADHAGSAETGVDRGASTADDTEGGASSEQLEPAPNERPELVGPSDVTTLRSDEAPPDLHEDGLAERLVELRESALPASVIADYSRTTVTAPPRFPCAPADWGAGVLVAVRYDGRPALVAFREPMGRSQVVEVVQCGTGDVIRSVTIPASR